VANSLNLFKSEYFARLLERVFTEASMLSKTCWQDELLADEALNEHKQGKTQLSTHGVYF